MLNKHTLYYKKNTPLTQYLESKGYELLKERSLMGKLFSKKEYAEIYFHQGVLDDEAIDKIKHAKKIIVNSIRTKQELMHKLKLNGKLIEYVYPAIEDEYIKNKEAKTFVSEQLGFDKKEKIILFTSKNLKQNGVKEFCDILMDLNYPNFKAIIAGDSKQIYNLKFQISKYDFKDRLYFVEDCQDMNQLFAAADIFLLPTHASGFNSNVLRAMYYKTAVFVTANNPACELVDVFATMSDPYDRSITFKVDALLQNKEELKRNKKMNKDAASEFSLEKQLSKLNEFVFDV